MEVKKKLSEKNATLWCVVVFVQYFLLPLRLFGLPSSTEYLVVFIAVLYSIYLNGIKLKFIRTIFVILVIFIADYVLFMNRSTFTFYLVSMFTSSLVIYWFSLNIDCLDIFFRVYQKYAILTYVAVIIYLFMSLRSGISLVSYMGIGNVLTFISIPIAYRVYINERKKLVNHLIMLSILVVSFFFANRMAIVSIFFIYQCALLMQVRSTRDLIKKIVGVIIQGFFIIVVALNMGFILKLINNFLINSNFTFYALIKLERMLTDTGGILAGIQSSSSGRDTLYSEGLDLIRKNNFLPQGISGFNFVGTDNLVTLYPHNFIIELLINFGFLGFVVLLVFLYLFFKSLKGQTKDAMFLLLIFIVFSVTKLFVSSSIWLAPCLWALIGFMENSNKWKKEFGCE